MQNIIIIHGIGGLRAEKGGYFAWLKAECEKLGLKVLIPSMPSYKDNGTYQQWYEIFEEELEKARINMDKQTIIFGQSMGAQFAVKYLTKTNKEIMGYISCGAPYSETFREVPGNEVRIALLEPTYNSFKVSEEEYSAFSKLKFPKFSIYSDNDCFFEEKVLKGYANSIGAQHVLVPSKGHFDVPEFPEALAVIQNLISYKSGLLLKN